MNDKRKIRQLFFVSLLALCMHNNVYSQFQGHVGKGGWGLLSGSQMEEGFLIAPVYINYGASKLMNKDGEEVRNITGADRNLSVNAAAIFAWWVSPFKILGANYGAMASIAFQENSIEFATLEFNTKFGMGDIYLQPINLGWHFNQLDVTASYGIYMLTGRYDAEASDNTGMGMWTNEFGAGATVFFDKNKNWHLSSLAYFEIHSKKKDTEIKVGNIMTLQGGLGRSFFEGALQVGASYYMQWKLSEDEIGRDSIFPGGLDIITLKNKHSVYALGPEVTVPVVLKGKLLALITARYQWEFGARSSLQGNALNLFIQFPFMADKEN